MATALQLPRSAWKGHPNYPHQVLLMGSHRNFRSVGQMLLERAQGTAGRSAILNSFSWWKSAMSGHEHYEEAKLYPFLEHRWGVDCDALRHGHTTLSDADRRVRAADAGPDLVAALQRHQDVLLEHLDDEERLVIPALLALGRDEFRGYSDHPLGWSLRRVPCHAGAVGCRACAPSDAVASRRWG